MWTTCLTSHLMDIPAGKHLAHGCVEVTVVGLTRCQDFPVQCILFWDFPCSPFSLRETKCKMLTFRQRSELAGDAKGSPAVWGSEPSVVSWAASTAATRQAVVQYKWPAERLILSSPGKEMKRREHSRAQHKAGKGQA